VAIVIDPGEEVCRARNQGRPDRTFQAHVIRNQTVPLRRGMRSLPGEGFRHIYKLDSQATVDTVEIVRQRLWTDRRDEQGPFDIIGDVHGCAGELEGLLGRLGYAVESAERDGQASYRVTPPLGRKAVFVGDLVDRGPRIVDTLRLVMAMVEDGAALCVLGNHEAKFDRWLQGREVKPTHGLDRSIAELGAAPDPFRDRVRKFIAGMASHYMLDGGRLAAAHAGIKEEMQGCASGAIRNFCLYGETTGEIDEFGLPVRLNWATAYRADTKVVFGRTPMPEPAWLNNTLCIDTGCVFGGRLTALRYPELELVSVPAAQVYQEPVRPLAVEPAGGLSARQEADDLLDLADVSGKRILTSRLIPSITIREENTAAALEMMSRFAIDPRWLIYLPPTMSPCETSTAEGYLEHPREAFEHYRREGLATVVCQEKHMGSRALLVVCRDGDTARRRFGVVTGQRGAIWTRSGRPFIIEPQLREGVLERGAAALDRSGLFDELRTDWVLLDCEIMPWSFKAAALIKAQYARTGAAAPIGLNLAQDAVHRAALRGAPAEAAADNLAAKVAGAASFARMVRSYAWPVAGVDELRIAPFHLLASQQGVMRTSRIAGTSSSSRDWRRWIRCSRPLPPSPSIWEAIRTRWRPSNGG
jgi:protein phosphatase